jgi:uncharacterized protein YceH (UPF0502 family)
MIDQEKFPLLSAEEVRVLGCLLEKEATTPDAYPLTLNSLLLACNQKTNRYPIVEYDEDMIAEAIENLRDHRLIVRSDGAGSRAPKFRHLVDDQIGLDRSGKALLAVLLLRGPQTLGELRQRTERMFSFATTGHVETALKELAEEVDRPLWTELPPAPGQKERRYGQLFSGEPQAISGAEAGPSLANPALDAARVRADKIIELEASVTALQTDLAELKAEFAAFRQQFD